MVKDSQSLPGYAERIRNVEHYIREHIDEPLNREVLAAVAVDDIQKEYERMRNLGAEFTVEPTNVGPATIAVFNDTCGNLIQI